MFVTLAGGYPRGAASDAGTSGPGRAGDERERHDRAVDAVLTELATIGLEPLSDGEVRWTDPPAAIALGLDGLEVAPATGPAIAAAGPPPIRAIRAPSWRAPITVDDWRYAASRTERAVKQAIVGPYTLGRRIDSGRLGRDRVTLAIAEALNAELRALVTAGCPLVEVQEDAAVEIGEDEGERRRFTEAQRRLLDGVAGEVHCTLAVRGGSVDTAGASTILEPPYRSFLLDLIAGPDNWRLIAVAPPDRGVVCGVMDVRPGRTMGIEELIFAARYAASLGGRGLVRVGLSPAGSMAHLDPADARSRLELLVRAAELAASSPEEIGRAMDPRAVDIRSAALGRYAPARRHGPGPAAPEVRKDGGAGAVVPRREQDPDGHDPAKDPRP